MLGGRCTLSPLLFNLCTEQNTNFCKQSFDTLYIHKSYLKRPLPVYGAMAKKVPGPVIYTLLLLSLFFEASELNVVMAECVLLSGSLC